MSANNFSIFTPLVVILWYVLYGWMLTVISAPLLYWAIAFGLSAFINTTITYSFLVSIPSILVTSFAVFTPLALDTTIILGNEFWQDFANNFRHLFWLSILALAIAMIWFSPLFWLHRQLNAQNLGARKIIIFMTGYGWIGLAGGWLLGLWT